MDLGNKSGVTTTTPSYGSIRSNRISKALDSELGFLLPAASEFATTFESIEAEESNLRGNGSYEARYGEAAVRGRPRSHRSTTRMAGTASLVSGAGSVDGTRQHVAGEKRKGKGRAVGDSQRQGAASKRSKHSKVSSGAPANNDRSQVGEEYDEEDGEDEEDEEEDDEEDSEEDDDCLSLSGQKDSPPFKCPMPSCRDNGKSFNTWNNLIQHLQNTHILGFASCPYFCGKRFGLSSQYTRHVFKNKSRCKPSWSNVVRIPPLALSLNYKISKIKHQDYRKLRRLIEQHDWYDVEDRNNPHSLASHIALNQVLSPLASQDQLLPSSFVQVPAGALQQFIQQFQSYLQIQTPGSTVPPTVGSSPELLMNVGPSSGQQAGWPPLHPSGLSQPAAPYGPRVGRGHQELYPTTAISRPSTGGNNGHTDYPIVHSSPDLPRRENQPYATYGSRRGNQPPERPQVYQTKPSQTPGLRPSRVHRQISPTPPAHLEPMQPDIPGISGPSTSETNYHMGLLSPPRHGGNPPRRMGNEPFGGNRRGGLRSQFPVGPSHPAAFHTSEVGGGSEQLSQPFLNYMEPPQPHTPRGAPLPTPDNWSNEQNPVFTPLSMEGLEPQYQSNRFIVKPDPLDRQHQSFPAHTNRDVPGSPWLNNPGGPEDNMNF